MRFHPDVLAAHAQFGGDLETMQRCYDWHNLKSENDRLRAELAGARNKALEEAARWHDAQAACYPASWKRKIAMHDISAAAIRAMKEETQCTP